MRCPQSRRDTVQISRSKPDSLHRTPAGFTTLVLDGNGLREWLPARPTSAASYPVSVRRVTILLHASFRRSLAVPPLRFASASPPSGCTGDFHPQAVGHVRHTAPRLRRAAARLRGLTARRDRANPPSVPQCLTTMRQSRAVMHFYCGPLMLFCSGVDTWSMCPIAPGRRPLRIC